jgi:hypothetical protein
VTLQALAEKMRGGLYLRDQMLRAGAARIVDDAARQIAKETSAERQFAGFPRDFFRKQNLEPYISHG